MTIVCNRKTYVHVRLCARVCPTPFDGSSTNLVRILFESPQVIRVAAVQIACVCARLRTVWRIFYILSGIIDRSIHHILHMLLVFSYVCSLNVLKLVNFPSSRHAKTLTSCYNIRVYDNGMAFSSVRSCQSSELPRTNTRWLSNEFRYQFMCFNEGYTQYMIIII
jgi:hypothetical protein